MFWSSKNVSEFILAYFSSFLCSSPATGFVSYFKSKHAYLLAIYLGAYWVGLARHARL
ncbi:hypothetical protein Psal071_00090 [Piscirickettsia salmonis]|uniref:Uncharacterized protein n=1 Tax=Piscirickettsia salmonis TaxID=1238 RepID=A0A9Q6LI21_PISSA|nr:hypothetical protein Psal006a_00091 [Piscirickettsia salmonis]QGO04235.1 hypothetical protein Psal009_00090 [Piscirickettsia salmonis]QGO32804.1 hypothetical protein Psal028_00090 [Piscirickettsia salmonis]QGO36416.1 hypothetical protein Psal040_00090 [Piscirickettsia salmonis]QGO40041.1 hypothetical protein Psal041_00090 [Piscirickettsia salmonis]